MKNSDLMQILNQINLSNKYKKFAIGLGFLSLAGISLSIYYQIKFKSAKNGLNQMNEKHDALLQESYAHNDLIIKQEGIINKFLSNQIPF